MGPVRIRSNKITDRVWLVGCDGLSAPGDCLCYALDFAALEADVLCEGHYGVIRGSAEVRRFIEQFLED
jgi:hypothetical protein